MSCVPSPLVHLFLRRPDLAPALLEDLRFRLPRYTVVRGAQLEPTAGFTSEHVAVVLQLLWAPVLGIVVELPQGISDEQRHSWQYHLASLEQREQCAVELLVVAPSREISIWAGQPLQAGRRRVIPHVLLVPPLLTAERARADPKLGLLSALAHADHPDERLAVRNAQLAQQAIFNSLADEEAAGYIELIRESFPPERRELLITPIPCPYDRDLARQYFTLGVAGALLDRFVLRFGPLPPGVTEHLLTVNLEELARLRYRLATATDLDEALGVPAASLAVKHGAAAHLIAELQRARHNAWRRRRRCWPWSRRA